MRNIKSLLVQLAIVFGLPAAIVGGYWYVRMSPQDELDLARKEIEERSAKVQEALVIISQLQFDDSLFKIPAFNTLEDQTVPIVDEPLGKPNPFTLPQTVRLDSLVQKQEQGLSATSQPTRGRGVKSSSATSTDR